MGQSGSHHHLHLFSHLHASHQVGAGDESHAIAAAALNAPPPLDQNGVGNGGFEDEDDQSASRIQVRKALHFKQQTSLLASLWLMSAATFRRSGKLIECRTAIQEAERVDPGEANVWVQLALWFEQQPPSSQHGTQSTSMLAIQSLYKALACQDNHVGATIHLARLFLTNPFNSAIRDNAVQEAIEDVAAPVPQTTDNVQPSLLASELLSHTQSRQISASPLVDEEQDSASSHALNSEKKRLATISLAEGLLISLTQGNGWNVSEAWLFLSRVMKETKRWEKQRECLEYALQLEKAKAIRSLHVALRRV
jgi:tetratricopeptide (TPR) repeat protein